MSLSAKYSGPVRPSAAAKAGPGFASRRAAFAGVKRAPRTSRMEAASAETALADVILAPSPSCSAPPETDSLLLILPGAFLGPPDFRKLAESIQEQASNVRLWVGLAAVDSVAMWRSAENGKEAAEKVQQGVLDRMVAKAKEQGFKARSMGWGRCTNLYLLAQSAAGINFSDVAFKSANGFILLASTFEQAMYSQQRYASMDDWGRPVMFLMGELDGQMRWFWSGDYAYDAACLAAKTSPTYAAANKPFILVPGANHGQTSNNIPNIERGDIPATADYDHSVAAMGLAVASFMIAHEGADAAARQAASSVLLRLVQQTAQLSAPYMAAKGLGDTLSVWNSPALTSMAATSASQATAAVAAAGSSGSNGSNGTNSGIPIASGAALLQGSRRQVNARWSSAVHPGVITEAERYTVEAQMRLASTLPEEVLSKVQVVACVHMDMEMLLRNQPTMEPHAGKDGKLLLLVHVLVWFPSTDTANNERMVAHQQSVAPQYWMKLKRPQAIAEELRHEGSFADGTTPQALNQAAIDAACSLAPEAAVQRYRESGKQLVAGADAEYEAGNAESFIKDSRITFAAQEDGNSVQAVSPRLTTKSIGETASAGQQVPDNPYIKRFLGNWYTKVMSTAMAMEWVQLDSLREELRW